MKITLFDTSVCSENLGDFIIMDSVHEVMNELFPAAMVFNTPTHEKISKPTYRLLRQSDLIFVGGTNLISSNMHRYAQWKINFVDTVFLRNAILLGVGWWQYQRSANLYTRMLLKNALNPEYMHSVRDSHTEEMFITAGITNVINTACPTMWSLSEEHCEKIPQSKGENVVVTLTDYNTKPRQDFDLISLLKKKYRRVFVWPQGSGDLSYIQGLGFSDDITVINPTLRAFNELFANTPSIDYVGTRLHAGIRALQRGSRSIILGIDNRAIEKAKDFNITVCPREELDQLSGMITNRFATRIVLPSENISRWKSQFN